MNVLLIIAAIVAVILVVTGGLVHAANFLLGVGLFLLVVAIIGFIVRFLIGRRSA